MNLSRDTRAELDRLIEGAFEDRSSRRTLMQRALAVGGAAGLAYVFPQAAFGQGSTPSGSEGGTSEAGLHIEDATGDLADEQVLRLSMSEPKSMDPGVSTGYDELAIFFNIFDGLTGVDMVTGDVVPRCAESWDINEDASQYTFHLRDNLKWSNGEPITAHDFEYSWKRVLDPETLSLYRPAMHPIKNATAIDADENPMDFNELGVTATDDLTLVVDMEGPTPFFPLLCSTWTYAPVPKAVIDEKGDTWVEAGNIISNGPYKMTEWNHDQNITLELNEHYYGETPTITRGEYTIFPDDSTQQYVSFENDELDIVEPGGPDLERALGDANAAENIRRFERSLCRMMTCDTKTAPTDNADFRRALYAALDRETIADIILKGRAAPAYNVLPADIPGNNPDAANPAGEDAAKAALEASGVDVSDLELEYSYYVSSDFKLVAEYIEQRIPEVLGFKVKLNPVDAAVYADYNRSRGDQPFNTKYGVWGSDFADPSNWHNQNFVSKSDHYYTSWVNEEYDDLCAQAVSETDPDKRAELYQQAEEILVHDAVYIPVYRDVAFWAVKPYVKNLHMQPILALVHLRYPKIEAH
ncbi:MAG TPA: peptide ABC transporter substrate-binding protein [Thermomicrobiales bacterium]|nr:peptide ABC transporter substrate-binding protein [Thermomicrobiales bacterium]